MDAGVKKYRPQASGNIMYHLRNLRLVPWRADFPVMLLEVSKHLQENTDESTRKTTPVFNYPDPSFTGHPHTIQEIVNGAPISRDEVRLLEQVDNLEGSKRAQACMWEQAEAYHVCIFSSVRRRTDTSFFQFFWFVHEPFHLIGKALQFVNELFFIF